MWIYEKKLQYPVKIKNPDPKAASVIISQLGGPGGKLMLYRGLHTDTISIKNRIQTERRHLPSK